ncbi:deoxyribonuclease-2-alpha [Spea bombifrons]|uniref:deoxyribonuclease-2-alpha n=1 Tax=Spea bombifrons TaxID=233779 RepID=UPI00234904F7|nr:deoxyribonuclease-2-alpha [Spea bombifrons]
MPLWSFMVLLFHISSSAAISCYGDSGQAVDWFIVYKLPKVPWSKSPDEGMKYMYQDAQSGGWLPGKSLMNNTASAVGRTLSQLYGSSKAKDVAYVLYNDQAPTGNADAIRGHTKGVVLLDKTQGFWLVHSTPHFPLPVEQKYGWPHNALHNGQSFLCVTYPYSQFKDIGTQLLYNTITAYNSSIPDDFSQDLPDLKAASQKKYVSKPPWNRQVTLTSAGGKNFTSFSKNMRFGDDLYSGWVSQVLKSDVYVQFWLNSHGTLLSNCSLDYHTYDIRAIRFTSTLNFSSHIDHSKWCVTGPEVPGWTCIGDMNRNLQEEHRGGGTVCVMDPVVWKSFYSLVSNYSICA